jgi:hypothetical protein
MLGAQWRRGIALFVVLAGATIQSGALAGEPSATDRQTARTLLIEGRKKLDAGDAKGAFANFKAAHALMRVPTTGLDLARAQEALGQLVEARATAYEVAHLPVAPNEPAAFTRARSDAAAMMERLEASIPSLALRVDGAAAGRVEVRVDGELVPGEALGAPRKLNPGRHEVVASADGFRTERREVTLKKGERTPAEVRLVLMKLAESPPAAVPAVPPETRPPVPLWAWAAGGVGVAALAGSVAFTADHLAARRQVDEECPGSVCDPSRHDLESMDALRARWNRSLGFAVGLGAVGLAGVGAAAWGLVARPQLGGERAMLLPLVAPAVQGMTCVGVF